MGPAFHPLRPRNILLLLGTVALYLGIRLENAALAGLGAGCAAGLLATAWSAGRLLSDVWVERRHLPRVFQNQTLGVELHVTTRRGRAPELLLIEDHFAPGSARRMVRLLPTPPALGEAVALHFLGECDHRRGLYVLGPVRLRATDPLGFFPREVLVEHFTDLLVYPAAVDLSRANLLGDGTLAHVGLEVKRRAGFSEEFLGVRDYRPGDPPRLVHWRSTAHHRALMVKEFEEEMTTLVSFFLDLSRVGLVGVGDQTSAEYSIRACASLAKRACERGHSLQLFALANSVDHVPPGMGTAHLLTILDRLTLARAQGETPFLPVVQDLAPSLPRGSTAILMLSSTTLEEEFAHRLTAQFVLRRILPIYVLVDDRAFIKVYQEQERRHIEARALREIAHGLRVAGARVLVLRKGKSMEEALLQALDQEDQP